MLRCQRSGSFHAGLLAVALGSVTLGHAEAGQGDQPQRMGPKTSYKMWWNLNPEEAVKNLVKLMVKIKVGEYRVHKSATADKLIIAIEDHGKLSPQGFKFQLSFISRPFKWGAPIENSSIYDWCLVPILKAFVVSYGSVVGAMEDRTLWNDEEITVSTGSNSGELLGFYTVLIPKNETGIDCVWVGSRVVCVFVFIEDFFWSFGKKTTSVQSWNCGRFLSWKIHRMLWKLPTVRCFESTTQQRAWWNHPWGCPGGISIPFLV